MPTFQLAFVLVYIIKIGILIKSVKRIQEKKIKKETSIPKSKTIKLDHQTHRLLRMYAAKNNPHLGEAVRNLLDKIEKKKRGKF